MDSIARAWAPGVRARTAEDTREEASVAAEGSCLDFGFAIAGPAPTTRQAPPTSALRRRARPQMTADII
jgi:hypothetical protein